jgi:hypothetical protein
MVALRPSNSKGNLRNTYFSYDVTRTLGRKSRAKRRPERPFGLRNANNSRNNKYKSSMISLKMYHTQHTAGPGSDDPEHDESTPAETNIVTFVLPSCIILRL